MNNDLITKIKKIKASCYFISPHFDDAVLSAGALMTYLSAFNRVVVVNIFTKAGKRPYTLSAKAYLKQCGYSDADQLYADRKKEDKDALSETAEQIIDLDFVDALWRTKTDSLSQIAGRSVPELGHIYPTYKFHIIKGKIARSDNLTVTLIKNKLTEIVDKNAVVFCPAGIGNHIDHVITRDVCKTIFTNLIYWSDFPYKGETDLSKFAEQIESFSFSDNTSEKRVMIERYTTQYKAMFHGGLALKPETFFYREGAFSV